MLKGIPAIIPPELMKILMEMGHGDELLICDGNYPKFGCPERCVRMDGHGIPEILDAILQFFPLDTYVDAPVTLMAVVPGDDVETPIWDEYAKIVEKHEPGKKIGHIGRFEFYDETRKAYAVVATSESALYANVPAPLTLNV